MNYLRHPGPLAFAHRGGNKVAPENTVEAFAHAVRLGYTYLETDVHLTKDGVLVAVHDAGLGRLAAVECGIKDILWQDIRAIELEGGGKIPTLDELLETFPDSKFNIDPKSDDAVEPLIGALQRHQALDRVGVGAFSDRRLRILRQQLGPRLCASPGPRTVAQFFAFVKVGRKLTPSLNRGFGCIQVPSSFRGIQLDRSLVEGFKALGLQVHVWTINTESEMHRLLDLGVDGIMTDDVELLRSVLIARGSWPGS